MSSNEQLVEWQQEFPGPMCAAIGIGFIVNDGLSATEASRFFDSVDQPLKLSDGRIMWPSVCKRCGVAINLISDEGDEPLGFAMEGEVLEARCLLPYAAMTN